jgi:hypothetical protein
MRTLCAELKSPSQTRSPTNSLHRLTLSRRSWCFAEHAEVPNAISTLAQRRIWSTTSHFAFAVYRPLTPPRPLLASLRLSTGKEPQRKPPLRFNRPLPLLRIVHGSACFQQRCLRTSPAPPFVINQSPQLRLCGLRRLQMRREYSAGLLLASRDRLLQQSTAVVVVRGQVLGAAARGREDSLGVADDGVGAGFV